MPKHSVIRQIKIKIFNEKQNSFKTPEKPRTQPHDYSPDKKPVYRLPRMHDNVMELQFPY